MKPVGSRTILLMSSALALVLCAAAPASAQMQSKEGSGMPGGNATGGEGRAAKEQGSQSGAEKSQKGAEPKGMTQGEAKGQPGQSGKGTTQSEPQAKSKGTAQTQPKEPGATQPKESGSKGSAQTQQPAEKGGKGTAETQPREPGKKGSAQTQPEPGGKGGAQTQSKEPSGKGTASETGKGTGPKRSDTAKGPSGGNRVQLSEQQRSTVHSTILKESNVNRATNVNFSVSVGTRVPRSVHLVALPASVLSIVPQYRSYEYFVADDQIYIVDPSSYEIVEVISGSARTAGTGTRGSAARLMLTEEEKEIILSAVGTNGGSTMGLGAFREGAEVPRGVQVRAFPEQVVQQVPKVERYRYFTAENSVAIVDPQGSRVEFLIESRR
jgi:hypothetical protein